MVRTLHPTRSLALVFRVCKSLNIISKRERTYADFDAELGRANEALGRKQDTFAVAATGTWLESLERSLVQMKEYQVRIPIDSLLAYRH